MELAVAGARVYVYTAGHALDPALPAVVFIHGGEQDHSAWALQSRYFAYHGHNALAPDLPGHGRSQGRPLGSIEAIADWVAALLDEAGLARAAVVGHSMGSLAALEFAARHPDRASAVALLGASAPMPVAQPLLAAAQSDDHGALEMINIWSYSSRALLGGNAAPGLWMPAMSMRLMERQRDGVLYADFKACNDYVRGIEAASRVECPALVIIGTRDQMTPARASAELARHIPHARTVTLRGSGHALMAEQPDAVLDALVGFLQPAA